QRPPRELLLDSSHCFFVFRDCRGESRLAAGSPHAPATLPMGAQISPHSICRAAILSFHPFPYFSRSGIPPGPSIPRLPPPPFRRSVPQPQIRDQLPVLLQVVPANVVQQPTALPYHLQQPPSRMVILRMTLEMPRQIVDPLRQERHLHPGGSPVVLVQLILLNYRLAIDRHVLPCLLKSLRYL